MPEFKTMKKENKHRKLSDTIAYRECYAQVFILVIN